MIVRFASATAFVVALVFAAGAASAATLIDATGTPLAEKVKMNAAPDGTTLTLKTDPGDYLVDYISSDTLQAAGNDGQGFAQVTGPFTDLTVDPQDPLAGFTSMKFKLDPAKANQVTFTFDTLITFLGGATQTITGTGFKGDNRFLLSAEGDEVISSVKFYNLLGTTEAKKKVPSVTSSYDFTSLKQVSLDGLALVPSAVPEPSTWALMITGFGLMGAAMRRRRTAAA